MIKIILLSDFSEEYSKNLFRGIMSYSKQHGPWAFSKMPTYYREKLGVDGILEWAKEWGANGIIGQFYNNCGIKKFKQAGIPVIAQDFVERFSEIPNITGSYYETGKMGAEYFLKKGFKNFAFYGFDNIVWSRERGEGFQERITEAGYQVNYLDQNQSNNANLWYYAPTDLSEWLKSLPKPVGLMTCDDNQGHHITEAARLAGIHVPDELAVLGVDNDEMICNLSDPQLSSIELDSIKCGFEAARVMEYMIQNHVFEAEEIVHKPTQIMTRCSTDIFASKDKYIVTALKYIHGNLDKNISVNRVLREVPISRRSLEKRFMLTTGYPVYEYIYNQRIEKFTQKLLETDLTISEIALDLGLSDSKNIARQFKQIKGLTPMEYRKKHMVRSQVA